MATTQHIYFLSGLGADERVFRRLRLKGYTCHFLNWFAPLRGESMSSYAARMTEHIEHPRPILVGLSFGGLMAIEISKQIGVQQIILLSSFKHRKEMPWYFKVVGKLGLHHLVPTFVYKTPNPILYWFFGTKSKEDKALLRAIVKDSPNGFLRWAIHRVLHWQNREVPANLAHIHGTADKLLPICYLKDYRAIEGGGHLAVWIQAQAVEEQILELLKSHPTKSRMAD